MYYLNSLINHIFRPIRTISAFFCVIICLLFCISCGDSSDDNTNITNSTTNADNTEVNASEVEEGLTFSLNRMDNGKKITITEKDFADKYLLMAVGYTGCPDICPTTMYDMKTALQYLDKNYPHLVNKIQPLFLTIDPTQDTLDDITQYTTFFDPRIIGLRAENFEALDDTVEKLNASYGYFFKNEPVMPPNLPKGYTVMHSTKIYLYSPHKRELLDVYPYNMKGSELAENIVPHIIPAPFKKIESERLEVLEKNRPQTANDKPVLVNFWASWCKPCRKELPFLQQLHTQGLATVKLINIEDKKEDAEKVLSEVGITELTTEYEMMEKLDELNIQGLPASIVYQGNDIFLGVGILKEEENISNWLNYLNSVNN